MADLRCALYGLRATDITLRTSEHMRGVVRIDLGAGVYVEVGGFCADVEAEAAGLDHLAEVATRAAGMLRAASSGETR